MKKAAYIWDWYLKSVDEQDIAALDIINIAFGLNRQKAAPQEPDGNAILVKDHFPPAAGATYSVISPVVASTNICLSIREFLGGIQSFLTSQFE